MSSICKSRFVRFMLLGAASVLFVSSFLPVWTVWYFNPWEGVGDHHSLWQVVWEIARAQYKGTDPNFPVTVTGDAIDLLKAGTALCIGGIIGAFYYTARRFNPSTDS